MTEICKILNVGNEGKGEYEEMCSYNEYLP